GSRAEENGRWLTYRQIATQLADYVEWMGYTHVELLPITEHPFDGSWGYQTIGYFAPPSRFGEPHDLMYLIDTLHQRGIGVILDWVPAHFPRDGHGLGYFDGTHFYQHADTLLRLHSVLRAREQAARSAPAVGHVHLQLRSRRGSQLSHLERAVLDRPLPR